MGFSVQKESLTLSGVDGQPPIHKPFARNGFSITFASGYIVSVQFGENNYCAKPDEKGYCVDAEVAVIAPDGSWATNSVWAAVFSEELGDDVAANVPPEKLVDVLAHVNNWLEVNHG